MTTSPKLITRGDIWFMDLSPATGKEKKGLHPVLIIQNDIGNKYSDLTIVSAITGNIQDYPVNVIVPPSRQNGLAKKSCIQCDQIYTIDKLRLRKKLGVLENQLLDEVERALRVSIQV